MKRTLKVLGAVVAASALFVGCQNDTDNSDIVQAIMTSAATTQKVSVENKLSAPEVFATIDNSGVALLKWNPVLGAKDYKVYSSYDDMKNWKYEGSSNNTFYRFDEPVVLNTNYKYKVVAVGEALESASATEGEFKSPETLSAIKALEADSIEVTENAVIKNAFDVEIKVNPAASYMAYLTPNTGDADLNISKAYGYSMFNVDGLSYATVNSQGKISEGTWRFTISSTSSADGEAVLTVVETPYNSKAFAANKVVSTKKVTLTPSNVSTYGTSTVVRTSPTSARVRFAVNKVNGKEVDATYDVYRTETKNGVAGGMSLIGQAKKSYSAEGSDYVEYAFDDENVAAVDNKDMISSYTYTVVAKTGSTTSAITTVQFNVNSASSDSATAVASNRGLLGVTGVTVIENEIPINKSEVNMTVRKTKKSTFKVYVASFSTLSAARNALPSEVTTEITSDFKAVESSRSPYSDSVDGVITDEGYDYYKLNNYRLDAGITVQNDVEYSSGYELVKNETKTTNTGKFYVFKMVTTREGYQDVVSIKKAYVTKDISVTKVGDAEPTKHEYYSVTIE